MAKGVNFGTVTAISASQGRGVLKSVYATNANAAARYLQIFDKASAPATNDVPVYSFYIPATTGVTEIGTEFFGEKGVNLFNGIAIGISTAANNYQAATASEHLVNWNIG